MLDTKYLIEYKSQIIEKMKSRGNPDAVGIIEEIALSAKLEKEMTTACDLMNEWRNILAKLCGNLRTDSNFIKDLGGIVSDKAYNASPEDYDKRIKLISQIEKSCKSQYDYIESLKKRIIDEKDTWLALSRFGVKPESILGELESAIAVTAKHAKEKCELFVELKNNLERKIKHSQEYFSNTIKKGEDNLNKALSNSDKMQKVGSKLKIFLGDLEDTKSKLLDKNLLLSVPNLPASDVPLGRSEEENVEISKTGNIREFDFNPLAHYELGERLGLMDLDTASNMSGSRFCILKGDLALLERVLGQFMMQEQIKMGFEEISAPYLVKEGALKGTGQLPKFGEELYKMKDNDLYLIPTAEVSLANLVKGKILEESDLPMRFCSLTHCFRREAGAAGRDNRGIIRQHQFQKCELVSIADQDKSEEEFKFIINAAQNILNLLGLPYRSVMLCCGDLGFSARKTVDLEVWIPSQKVYREISSISNCGTFQARRLNARIKKEDGKKEFVHTLNGSGLAIGRTLAAVMENYQMEDGSIKVPDALVGLLGKDVIRV